MGARSSGSIIPRLAFGEAMMAGCTIKVGAHNYLEFLAKMNPYTIQFASALSSIVNDCNDV